MLGHMYELGPSTGSATASRFLAGVLPLPGRRVKLVRLKDAVNLGNAYQRGVLTPVSIEKAREAFGNSCRSGYSWAAVRLGLLDAETNREQAVPALRRSCELADAEGCWILRRVLLEGGTTEGRREAVAALTAGCERGTSVGSDEFNRARAAQFAEKACQMLSRVTPAVPTLPPSKQSHRIRRVECPRDTPRRRSAPQESVFRDHAGRKRQSKRKRPPKGVGHARGLCGYVSGAVLRPGAAAVRSPAASSGPAGAARCPWRGGSARASVRPRGSRGG